MRSLKLLAMIAALAVCMGGAAEARNGSAFFMHNGSVVQAVWGKGNSLTIYYASPKVGLPVGPGTILFEGHEYTDGRVSGTAHTFSSKCGIGDYQVSGHINEDEFYLDGPAPVLDTNSCVDVGYSSQSSNAHLEFFYLHD